MDALRPVLEALDTLDTGDEPLTLFLRDDDAGWDDARLLALLESTAHAGVPIDLATIPQALSGALARELNARIDAAPGLVGVHQHGFGHWNHEAQGRSCEFGPARDAATQRQDLLHGRVLLRGWFGKRLQPIFTPPWNRCASHTPALLAELGYTALSRDHSAPVQSALPELPIDVDWTREHRAGGPAAVAAKLSRAVRARQSEGRPLGLMLHHAVLEPGELVLLGSWLQRLVQHPNARWRPMSAVLAARVVGPRTNQDKARPR